MMRVMRRVGATLVVVGMGWAASACGSSVFACSSDEQCQGGAGPGMCQPEGYCSFPDDGCDSGQRFGDAAPAGVANVCVALGEGTSTGVGPEPSSGGVEPPDPEGSTSTSVGEGSTTVAVEGTTTITTTGPGPEPTTFMGSEGSTTNSVEACSTTFVEPFDGSELSPMWSPFLADGMEMFVEGGRLGYTLPISADYLVSGANLSLDSVVGGAVRVLVSELPEPALPMAAGIGLGNETCQLQLFLVADGLDALLWNAETQMTTWLANEPEPTSPIWLQLRQDEEGSVHYEWSPNAVEWNELAIGSFPECGDLESQVIAGVSVGGQLDRGMGTRTFDQFEVCQ